MPPSIKFTSGEKEFLKRNEACRLATSYRDVPHIVPVSYLFEDGLFYFATDFDTKKYNNIKRNNRVALAIDIYSSVGNKAVCIMGTAKIIESGKKFRELYDIFHKRFEWVRRDPWKEREAAFVEVTPIKKVSWGIR
jgi:nitroimidazol reductase NimA-like FMN-containing flavoprotein (pyridoxamine 5'-phosphate oxidase superfamily)